MEFFVSTSSTSLGLKQVTWFSLLGAIKDIGKNLIQVLKKQENTFESASKEGLGGHGAQLVWAGGWAAGGKKKENASWEEH